MGKGDKKTRKGKITMGSYGVLRPRKKATWKAGAKVEAPKKVVAETPKKAAAPKKAAPKKETTAKKTAPKKAAKKAE